MPKGVVKLPQQELAAKAGQSQQLVSRKRRQGKDDATIIAEAGKGPAVARKQRTESYADAQARKETALANLRELEEAEKRSELLDRKETEAAWSSMISEAKASMLNIGDELGDVLAAEMNPIRCRELVNDKVREALTALAG